MEKKAAFCMLKALIVAYVVTGVLLVVLSFALWKLGISELIIGLGVTGIYLFSCAAGGFFIGKCMETKRLLWGSLIGFLYALVLIVVSLIARGGFQGFAHGEPARLLVCLCGGAIGAFLS